MPTTEERIAAIQARISTRDKRLEEMKAVQKIKEANKADLAALENLKADEERRKADEKRKADSNSKILLGAGVQKLPEPLRSRAVVTVLSLLDERDQARVKPWAVLRDVDLSATPLTDPTIGVNVGALSPVTLTQVDQTPNAVLRVLAQFDAMELSFIEAQFLKAAQEDDRGLIEQLFARLGAAATDERGHKKP